MAEGLCFNSRDLPVNTSATGSRAWVLLYAKSCALARQAGSTLYCGRLFLLTVVCLPSWQSPLLRRHYCNCSCPTYLGTPSPPPTEPKHKAPPHRPCQSRCNSADPVGHAQQRVKCARPEPYLSRRAVGLHVCPAAKASSRPKPLTAIRGQQTHTTHTYVCRMATAPLIDMPAIGVLTIGAAQQHLRYTMRRMTHSSTEVESPATTFTSSSSSSLTPSGSFALSCHGKAAPLSAVHFPPSPW